MLKPRTSIATALRLTTVALVFVGVAALPACSTENQNQSATQSEELSAYVEQAPQSASGEPQNFAAYWDQVKRLPPAATEDEYQQLFVEAVGKYADCMEERGWPRPVLDNPYTPFASIAEEVAPVGQEAAKFEDEKACLDLAAPWPEAPALTRESLSADYDRQVAFRQCIIDHGGSLSEPPTREKYIEDSLTSGDVWVPQEELRRSGFWSNKTMSQIYEVCPW